MAESDSKDRLRRKTERLKQESQHLIASINQKVREVLHANNDRPDSTDGYEDSCELLERWTLQLELIRSLYFEEDKGNGKRKEDRESHKRNVDNRQRNLAPASRTHPEKRDLRRLEPLETVSVVKISDPIREFESSSYAQFDEFQRRESNFYERDGHFTAQVSTRMLNIYPKFVNPPPEMVDGSPTEIQISFVESLNNFWVQKKSKAETIHEFHQNLQTEQKLLMQNRIHKGFPPTEILVRGMMCAARHSATREWYRARILRVNRHSRKPESELEVLHVDTGYTDQVRSTSVMPLHVLMLSDRTQAVHCRLGKLPPSLCNNPHMIQKFMDLTNGRLPVTVEFGPSEPHREYMCDSYSVDIYLGQQNLLSFLLEEERHHDLNGFGHVRVAHEAPEPKRIKLCPSEFQNCSRITVSDPCPEQIMPGFFIDRLGHLM